MSRFLKHNNVKSKRSENRVDNRNPEQYRANFESQLADQDTDFNIKSMPTSNDVLDMKQPDTDATSYGLICFNTKFNLVNS